MRYGEWSKLQVWGFLAGVALRVALCVLPGHVVFDRYYGPFLTASLRLSVDPWSAWVEAGGPPDAFPYGYAMWLLLLPGQVLAAPLGTAPWVGYVATLFIADLALFLMISAVVPDRQNLALTLYWLSPVVLVSTYVMGFNDLVPTALVFGTVFAVKRRKHTVAGFLAVAAVSSKASMLLAIPFAAMFLLHNPSMRRRWRSVSGGAGLAFVTLIVPFLLLSSSGTRMILTNPESAKVLSFVVPVTPSSSLYVVPLAYAILAYLGWRIPRLNLPLLVSVIALALGGIAILVPASPGWYVWSLPFLVVAVAQSDSVSKWLLTLFGFTFVIASALPYSSEHYDVRSSGWLNTLAAFLPDNSSGLAYTGLAASGLLLGVRLWRHAVASNDYFRFSKEPYVLAIAGDSGTGKDTLSAALVGLFGADAVATISGDDYHRWDRQRPMWRSFTHLHPAANDLDAFERDVVALKAGSTVSARHYDHVTGKMSRPVRLRGNGVLIASGLHALSLPGVRSSCNLGIYLDMDERLRRHLKLRRDVLERGHTEAAVLEAIERRVPDFIQFVQPQRLHADIVFALVPSVRLEDTDGISGPLPPLQLRVSSRWGWDRRSLSGALVGVCGLNVDILDGVSDEALELVFDGDVSGADMAIAAERLCPRMLGFLDDEPVWCDGPLGLMQLLTLIQIDRNLARSVV